MKKIIASITMLAAGAALASTVTSAQTFGVLKVTSTTAETAICVPWVAAGTGGAIKVKDFVKTTGLKEGDVLLKYDNSTGTYYGWQLDADDGSWVGAAVVIRNGESSSVSDNETLARGDALIIRRSAPTNPGEIYLYGQYTETEFTSVTMAASTSEEKVTLFALPNTTGTAIDLNRSGWTWSNVVRSTAITTGDTIRLQKANGTAIYLAYNGDNWVSVSDLTTTTNAVIQPGMGAWYIAVGKSDRADAPSWSKD